MNNNQNLPVVFFGAPPAAGPIALGRDPKISYDSLPNIYKNLDCGELITAINHQKQYDGELMKNLCKKCCIALLYKVSHIYLGRELYKDRNTLQRFFEAYNFIQNDPDLMLEKLYADLVLQDFVGEGKTINIDSLFDALPIESSMTLTDRLIFDYEMRNDTYKKARKLEKGANGYNMGLSFVRQYEVEKMKKCMERGQEYKPRKERLRDKVLKILDLNKDSERVNDLLDKMEQK